MGRGCGAADDGEGVLGGRGAGERVRGFGGGGVWLGWGAGGGELVVACEAQRGDDDVGDAVDRVEDVDCAGEGGEVVDWRVGEGSGGWSVNAHRCFCRLL